MVARVIPTLSLLFSEVINLFDRIFTGLGAWEFFFGGLVIFLTYRFLLVPLFGGAGSSDKVRKKTSTSDMDD